MKCKAIFLALLVVLLTGCSGNEKEAQVSQTPAPLLTESPAVITDPAAWLGQADLSRFPGKDGEEVSFEDGSTLSRLGSGPENEVTLYALTLSGAETPLLILRQGDSLFSLDSVPDRPSQRLSSVSAHGDGLALLWYSGEGQENDPAYDLDILTPEEEGWVRCTVSRDACARLIRDEVEVRWDDRSNTFSLTCAGQTASMSLTAGSPGELVLGRLCLFPQIGNGYELVMSAGCESGQIDLAVLRAEIIVNGETFTLQNLRMEVDPGV